MTLTSVLTLPGRPESAQAAREFTAACMPGCPAVYEAMLCTGELVLANLESGRRETVSLAEILVLAAALGVSPIELMCPVGFDEKTELLPGRIMDPREAMQWFTGEMKLQITETATKLRPPGSDERSSTYLVEYHDQLISRLRVQEADAARALADAKAEGADDRAFEDARYKKNVADEWRSFIREPLRQTRAEMRARGMVLPKLPPDIDLEEGG